MYYNLIGFGKRVSNIRNSFPLTREQLSSLTIISMETIRKIEKGKYLPSQQILDSLGYYLKIDLNKLLLDYRLDDFETFDDIKNKMESKFDRDEFYTLEEEYNDFNRLLEVTKNKYYQNLIRQLMLLIQSIILNKDKNKPQESLHKLIEAIQISTPEFSLSNYKDFVYNDMEIRILMNISMLLKKLESKEKSLSMKKFCLDISDPNNPLYPKICYNLAGGYHLIEDYKNALKYYDLGILHSTNKRNLNGLNLFYYGKGLAEYKLGCNEYIESLNKAISLCDILGQDNLKKVIIDKCKKFHNIEL